MPADPEPFHFDGFDSPNVTPVPDEFFDVLAPRLGEAELRVLLYIMRRTFGFKKESDNISLKQMVEGITTKDGRELDRGAGISKPAATKAIKSLIAKGVITAVRNRSAERGDEPTTYSLRFKGRGLTNFTRGGGYSSSHGGVKLNNPQHDSSQHDRYSSSPTPSSRTGPPANAGAARQKKSDDASQLPKKRVGENPVPEAGSEPEARPSLDLITALTAQGVSRSMAKRLVEEYPRRLIEQELQLLPHRKGVKDPAAYLVRAIRAGDFLPPAELEAERRREEARVSAQAAEARREAERQAAERERQQRIEAVLAELPAVDRANLEERARVNMARISKKAAEDPRIVRSAVYNLIEKELLPQ